MLHIDTRLMELLKGTRLSLAKGFTQTYEANYFEIFAPIARNTVRVILSLASNHDWNLQQFDVKIFFYLGILKKKYT